MKRSSQSRRGVQDGGPLASLQPEKAGWIRRFCGRGIFRELWRSRFVMLRGDRLYISEKEVKDERKAQEVLDLADYERSEELRKAKSRSKKNHSRFTVTRCRRPGNTVPNLVFLAVSPEEKESWVNALNVAIIKAKNRVLDEVTIEDDCVLVHPTRDRAKIPHSRRLPTRGHLLAVASTSSRSTLMLDLVAEEDNPQDPWDNDFQVDLQHGTNLPGGVGGRQRAGTDASKLLAAPKEPKVKTGSLPRGSERSWGRQSHLEVSKVCKAPQVQVQSRTPQPGKRFSMQGRSRCASMDEVLSSRPALIRSELRSELRRCPTEESAAGAVAVQPVGQLQSLIAQRMQRAQELLEEMRLQELQKAKEQRERGGGSPCLKAIDSPRLHHLRGSDSPHSSRSSGSARSRSSDSPRLRSKDSPRIRGRESPRSRAKRSRSKTSDSPRSRGSASPRLKAPPHHSDSSAARSSSSKLDQSSPGEGGARSPQADGSPMHSESSSPCLMSTDQVPCQDLSSPFGSFGPSLPKSCSNPQLSPPPSASPPSEEDEEVERRRAEAERLLEEAVSSWREAQEVLQEVKELQSQTLRRQRRRTYEKMTSVTSGLLPATAVAVDDDTPASPTSPSSPMDEDDSETP